jgi:hypothetical protein
MDELDLRTLIMMINEKKQLNANLSLEFDCIVQVEDTNMLVKILNYAINYINQLSDQPMQISLNASMKSITAGFTTFTEKTDLPQINPQVSDALKKYEAAIELKHEAGKYAQIIINFYKFKTRAIQ